MDTAPASRSVRPLVLAGAVLGVGLGGFVDGIVLHQVFQWHHMVTAYDHNHYAPTTLHALEVNTLWDGLFHSATWIAVVVGVVLLMRAERLTGGRLSGRVLFGSTLAGWGGFNVVEGAINHHLLGLHHVRDDLGGPLVWDLGFLAFGVLVVLAGMAIIRTGSDSEARSDRPVRGVAL